MTSVHTDDADVEITHGDRVVFPRDPWEAMPTSRHNSTALARALSTIL